MPVNLSVKNVADVLAERLRRRAAANRRSLQRELISILEAAVGRGPTARTDETDERRDEIDIEDLDAIARRLFPKGTESSVDYLRQLRDSR